MGLEWDGQALRDIGGLKVLRQVPPLQSFSFAGLFSYWFSICRQSCSNSATWKVWGQGVGQYYVALLVGNHGSSAKTAAGVS